MLLDLDNDQVMYCTIECKEKKKSNKTLDINTKIYDSLMKKAKFILDTTDTKHIFCDRRYKSNYLGEGV